MDKSKIAALYQKVIAAMDKRILAALVVVLIAALALILAFCGAEEEPQPSQPADTTVSTTAVIPSTTVTTRPTTVPTTLTTVPTTTAPKVILEYLQPYYDQNPHTVGWIEIEGTMVDYPVVQTPNEPEWINYYLYRDFYGNDHIGGSIYMREACDVFAPSDNLVLYGHNMANHTMFGEVLDYRYYDHYLNHKYIRFDTLYEEHTYEIFAVFRTSGTTGVGFPYHLFNEAQNEEEFDAFVAECKRLSLYEIDLTPQYGDKLITLSTCDFSITNGRLVVVAMRIE